MKTFTVTVNWEVSKDYEVEANNSEEARAKIQKMVDEGEVCVWTDGFEATDNVEVEAEKTVFKVVNVTNIDWDTSDYDDDNYDPESLPSEVSDVDLRLDPDEADNEDYIEEAISDWLSDVYGFCVNSFSYEEVKD